MASAVDSRLAYARLSAVATASRLPTANRGSNNSYTTSWDTTQIGGFNQIDAVHARASNVPTLGIRNYHQSDRVAARGQLAGKNSGAPPRPAEPMVVHHQDAHRELNLS